ncbi:MAG TPA: hypothetical protein VGF98_01125 [Candidatus Tumulicola sp.]|jgi:predicted DNA-binding transcriptional regulator
MTDSFLQRVADAVREGLTVSEIEHRIGCSNRNVRRAKSELYRTGILTATEGSMPQGFYANRPS